MPNQGVSTFLEILSYDQTQYPLFIFKYMQNGQFMRINTSSPFMSVYSLQPSNSVYIRWRSCLCCQSFVGPKDSNLYYFIIYLPRKLDESSPPKNVNRRQFLPATRSVAVTTFVVCRKKNTTFFKLEMIIDRLFTEFLLSDVRMIDAGKVPPMFCKIIYALRTTLAEQ